MCVCVCVLNEEVPPFLARHCFLVVRNKQFSINRPSLCFLLSLNGKLSNVSHSDLGLLGFMADRSGTRLVVSAVVGRLM